ncbi:helix-turn-helix domain-containing protein [Burkholderia pseudomallei]|uniref:helix-turn-helix domain-containing protein n=1 Tax=Burkholderia pseudomallei TaxID=28450 RepID=UPI00097892FA|nr:helix-turn-helix transcriptional regulator [Burkholderia pseudomallei]MCD4518941.1 helix-turn-helix domain-containing protein [Burkholderia pseudomallei]
MNTIGSRLREERLRLGLSQDEFAAIGGVLRRAQSNYESDERSPDAKYLSAIAGLGVDLLYVLTGSKQAPAESSIAKEDADELELVRSYRQLNDAGKAALVAFVESCFKTGAMVDAPTARRAKRLPENRRAALDQRTAENVDRAMAEIERLRAERAAKAKKE